LWGRAVGRMRVVGFTERVSEPGREGEAPAEPAPCVGLGGSLALPGQSPAKLLPKSDDPHPALRATLPRGEREFKTAFGLESPRAPIRAASLERRECSAIS